MTVDIEILKDREAYAALRDVWNKMAIEDPESLRGLDSTSTYEWFEAILEAFPEAGDPSIVIARQDSRIVGLLPILINRAGKFGPNIFLPTEEYGGRNGPLMNHQTDPRIFEALFTGLDIACPGWVTFQMTLVPDSAVASTVRACCDEDAYSVVRGDLQESLFFPIGSDEESVWSGIGKDIKQRIRKSERMLGEKGQLTRIDMAALGAEDADSLLGWILEIERQSWKHRAGTAITNHPRQERFYRALLPRALRSGLLCGQLLLVDGKPASYLLGLRRGGVYIDLKNSFADEFASASPSHATRYQVALSLLREGVQRFDFMGVIEPFKTRYSTSNQTYARQTWVIYNRTWKAAVVRRLRQLKHWLKRFHSVDPDAAAAPMKSDT